MPEHSLSRSQHMSGHQSNISFTIGTPGQLHSTVAFLGQPNQLPQVLHPLASQLDPPASARCPLTSAMPILRWLPTQCVPEPSLWLCFWPHGPALLPSHDRGYSSIAPYSTFLAGQPFVTWRYPGAGLFLQDPILSPLDAYKGVRCSLHKAA